MSYAAPRSRTAELAEGMSDGLYMKINTDRGGVVEMTTHEARYDLLDGYWGQHEAPIKHLPDGTKHATPGFVSTPGIAITGPMGEYSA